MLITLRVVSDASDEPDEALIAAVLVGYLGGTHGFMTLSDWVRTHPAGIRWVIRQTDSWSRRRAAFTLWRS